LDTQIYYYCVITQGFSFIVLYGCCVPAICLESHAKVCVSSYMCKLLCEEYKSSKFKGTVYQS